MGLVAEVEPERLPADATHERLVRVLIGIGVVAADVRAQARRVHEALVAVRAAVRLGRVHALVAAQVVRPRERRAAETTRELLLIQMAHAVVVLELLVRLEHLRADWAGAGATLAGMDLEKTGNYITSGRL